MIWFRRILFLGIGLVVTAIGFHFWLQFAGAMGNLSAAPPPRHAAPANPGEVTVGIIPAPPQKPACDKKYPCP